MLKACLVACSCLVIAIGCGGGGGSGISGSKRLSDLTDAEAQDLCQYAEDAFGPMRTVTCNDQTFEIGGEDNDCETATAGEIPETCTATVGQFEDCMDAIAADPCVLTQETPPPVCAFLADANCA